MRAVAGTILAAALVVAAGAARAQDDADVDLAELSLSDLMDVEVTSVSKKSESLGDAAAAIYVITADDIRRSGHTSIPELLRTVPGLHVAHIDANKWAISSRGLNERFTNKLLVLIDGRSVYTPLFGGVYWDVQDTMIEDVERIEVIRGPGATVWGANAVNGVINIITKSAADTQGGLFVAGGGDRERGFAGLRYGGKLGEGLHWRAYAKTFKREPFVDSNGDEAEDEWDVQRAGFRMDWEPTARDLVTLQGDVYAGDADGQVLGSLLVGLSEELDALSTPVVDRQDLGGGNLLARWTRTFSEMSDLQLQVYYDRTERNTLFFDEDRDTVDVDFQHRFSPLERHDLVWGAGYRLTRDAIDSTSTVGIRDSHRHDHLFSAFVQDQVELVEDRFWITFGTKLEHNSYTGWEFQPSGRFLWKPHEQHTLWGAVSRAVKTPTRADEDVRFRLATEVDGSDIEIPLPTVNVTVPTGFPPPNDTVVIPFTPDPFTPTAPVPLVIDVDGDEDFDSTVLYAYELGYRFTPRDSLWFDLALFYNDYRRLDRSAERGVVFASCPGGTLQDTGEVFLEVCPGGAPPLDPVNLRFVDRRVLGTRFDGHIYGLELAASWEPTERWQLLFGYSYLNANIENDNAPGVTASGARDIGLNSPSHQFHVRSYVDLPWNLEFDTALYWVGNTGRAGSYARADVRLGWQAMEHLELSIVGQNLFERSHPEISAAQAAIATEVPRSFYGKLTWSF